MKEKPTHFILLTKDALKWEYNVVYKILIMDEEIIFCNALRYHLTHKGYDVKLCSSYNELQDKINLFEFDLIVLDLNFKNQKGLEILQIAKGINPKIQVIFVSGYPDHQLISKAKALGANAFACKNVQLFQVLDQIMETM
ncbi:MAG: response regulator [bacterium]